MIALEAQRPAAQRGRRPVRVMGISGSLRRGSLNTRLLRAIQRHIDDIAILEITDISPLYDEDVRERGFPASVVAFRSAISEADAVLFAVPEYNRSFPGVLKNALDWASRPPAQPLDGKVVGFVSASPGMLGGARGQTHFRQCFIAVNSRQISSRLKSLSGTRKISSTQREA